MNFLAFSNDEADMTKKMMGYDIDQNIPELQGDDPGRSMREDEKSNRPCIQNIIIMPEKSIWKRFWDTFIIVILFMGYYRNMYHIAFYIDLEDDQVEMTYEKFTDIVLCVDIFLKFFTAYQKDVEWVTNIFQIIFNYLKQSFIIDMLALLPSILSDQSNKFYWFKLFRFLHLRDVFNHISSRLKLAFQKCGLNKSLIDKVPYVLNLLINFFTSIHILACCWIYIGQ